MTELSVLQTPPTGTGAGWPSLVNAGSCVVMVSKEVHTPTEHRGSHPNPAWSLDSATWAPC